MKKLLLSLTVAAFAVAVQAGDDACPAKGGSCCSKSGDQTKVTCSKAGEQAKAGCCAAKNTTAKSTKPLPSPKATTLASK
jgi:hypothetical protein